LDEAAWTWRYRTVHERKAVFALTPSGALSRWRLPCPL